MVSQNREQFVLSRWAEAYPDMKYYSYTQILSLVNRSKSVAEWYVGVKADFDWYNKVPSELTDLISISEYRSLSDKLIMLRDSERNRSRELTEIAEKAKKQADSVNARYNRDIEIAKQNDIVFILSLRFEDLPVSLTNRVILQEYESDDARKEAERKCVSDFKRECVIRSRDGTFNRGSLEIIVPSVQEKL